MKALLSKWTMGAWVLLLVGVLVAPAQATSITFTGSSGSLAASATFTTSGTDLLVTLDNTSGADVLVPANVLTAVFFTIAGNPTLSKTSALLGGSTVFYDTVAPFVSGGVVGGEWAYKSGLSQYGANEGISSSGFSGATSFAAADRFPGPDLAAPTAPDGLQYGLLSTGDNTATGNTGVTGSGGLIKHSVNFTLGGFGAYSLSNISNVTFQYGTALTEPHFGGNCTQGCGSVPEPASVLLLGTGLVGLGLWGWKRRREEVQA